MSVFVDTLRRSPRHWQSSDKKLCCFVTEKDDSFALHVLSESHLLRLSPFTLAALRADLDGTENRDITIVAFVEALQSGDFELAPNDTTLSVNMAPRVRLPMDQVQDTRLLAASALALYSQVRSEKPRAVTGVPSQARHFVDSLLSSSEGTGEIILRGQPKKRPRKRQRRVPRMEDAFASRDSSSSSDDDDD
ncbi:MAG: hypothetical protein MHM6MM_003718 [Cercozoa sp. M6MM]